MSDAASNPRWKPPALRRSLSACFGPLVAVLIALLAAIAHARSEAPDAAVAAPLWHDQDEAGRLRIHVYLFWSRTCPHCLAEKSDLEAIAVDRPWLVVHLRDVAEPAVAEEYVRLASELGQEARAVPGTAFCGALIEGAIERAQLATQLDDCHDLAAPAPEPTTEIEVPFVGVVDVGGWSLLLTTVVLAGLDAFNPCAFFVLITLLGMLTHARGRGRMAIVAFVFVLISGVWYFTFMAAWLNVFLWMGELRAMTIGAGIVAIAMALLDLRDVVGRPDGLSRSIPAASRPGLFRRMRGLLRTDSLTSVLLGTIVLAAVANSYELLCTAGFPMVYTRVLTLAGLPAPSYYAYLALYNAIYVVPLLVIAAAFVATLGSHKLQERHARALKLLSGTMMLTLGLALLVAPQLLSSGVAAAALLGIAVGVTAIFFALERGRTRRSQR